MDVLLIRGFSRHGKDTFYQSMCGKNNHRWYIYRSSRDFLPDFEGYHRKAFADGVKKRFPPCDDGEKDSKLLVDPVTQRKTTFRQAYIEEAAKGNSQDPEYWCKVAFSGICSGKYCVTDWRRLEEYKYIQDRADRIATLFVWRSDQKEPPELRIEEHYLDNQTTQFLVLSTQEDFRLCVERFPQYRSFSYYKALYRGALT